MNDARGGLLIGFAAALTTATIWASWYVLTRLGVQSFDLSVVVLLRYILPVLIFAPVLFRIGIFPKGLSKLLLAIVILTGGLGFVMLAAMSLRLSPAAEVAPILPGAPPLFVALYAWLWQRERFGAWRAIGFAMIACGLLIIVLPPIWTGGGLQLGHFAALAAAFDWAIYTMALRRSKLGAVEVTALISFWCGLVLLPFGLPPLIEAIQAEKYAGLLLQVLIQGVATGIVATILFAVAVRRLGGPSTTAVTALAPVISAIIAVVILHEYPQPNALAGMVAIVAGVVLANWPRRPASG